MFEDVLLCMFLIIIGCLDDFIVVQFCYFCWFELVHRNKPGKSVTAASLLSGCVFSSFRSMGCLASM